MVRNRYLFKMYYIGTKKYFGSQRQPNFITIEETLLNALVRTNYINDIDESEFETASRTDRFVSARSAYFSFITDKKPILMEINSALPIEIGLWAYAKVAVNFASRYNAILRHYIYIYPTPLTILKTKYRINIKLIEKACKLLEGKHDFLNFSKRDKELHSTIRDMESVKLTIVNDFLIFHFKSRAFLRQQVRRMVKKLLELGKGKIEYEDFLQLFDASKFISYQPANPNGVILWDIIFDDKVRFNEDIKSKERMERFFRNKEILFNFKNQLFKVLQHNNFS
ncbi:MAG: tRNA pseudouridine synthase A [Promethearchaeota archaeon]